MFSTRNRPVGARDEDGQVILGVDFVFGILVVCNARRRLRHKSAAAGILTLAVALQVTVLVSLPL